MNGQDTAESVSCEEEAGVEIDLGGMAWSRLQDAGSIHYSEEEAVFWESRPILPDMILSAQIPFTAAGQDDALLSVVIESIDASDSLGIWARVRFLGCLPKEAL